MPTGLSINSIRIWVVRPNWFDISAAKPQADGSYLWKIKGTCRWRAMDISEIISEGKAAIVIESTALRMAKSADISRWPTGFGSVVHAAARAACVDG